MEPDRYICTVRNKPVLGILLLIYDLLGFNVVVDGFLVLVEHLKYLLSKEKEGNVELETFSQKQP